MKMLDKTVFSYGKRKPERSPDTMLKRHLQGAEDETLEVITTATIQKLPLLPSYIA